MLETPLILEIGETEIPGGIPLTSNEPKILRIETRSDAGPLVLRISLDAVSKLAEALSTHSQVRGSQ